MSRIRAAEPIPPPSDPKHGATASDSSPVAVPPSAAPTFTRDVAPILFNNCAVCHHPGGAGPFGLLTYADARKRAGQIALVTGKRFMPPWLPEPGYGKFLGERRLERMQIDTLARWAEAGAPEGDAADLPPEPTFKDSWKLGPPDLVLDQPEAYRLAPGGTDAFWNFVFPIPGAERRYVSALEVMPGNTKVVHHANVLVDRDGSALKAAGPKGEIGFGGMKVDLQTKRFEPQSHFLFWKPGSVAAPGREGMSWPVGKGTALILNMHMKPSGKTESVKPSLGLHFTDAPPTRFPMLIQLEHDGALDIPAGDAHFVVTDTLELPVDVELLAIYPHAHYLGKEIQAYATLPDATRVGLIWIKDWNLDWQAVYDYERPVRLPKGAIVTMTWTYDNSDANIRNPHRPAERVRSGNASTDEMSHLWLQVVPGAEKDRMSLGEASMRAKVRKYPAAFEPRLGLGSVLQAMARNEEAIATYRQALKIRPGDPTAENNLGAAILASGVTPASLDEAIRHFETALRTDPGSIDGHYNLGGAHLARGSPAQAEAEFLHIVYLRPDDADAHAGLGEALLAEGKQAEAEARFKVALRWNPNQPGANYGLGYLAALRGDLDRARGHLERAVTERPNDARARTILGSVYASQGRMADAIAQFEAALRDDPGNADARKNLERAKSMQEQQK